MPLAVLSTQPLTWHRTCHGQAVSEAGRNPLAGLILRNFVSWGRSWCPYKTVARPPLACGDRALPVVSLCAELCLERLRRCEVGLEVRGDLDLEILQLRVLGCGEERVGHGIDHCLVIPGLVGDIGLVESGAGEAVQLRQSCNVVLVQCEVLPRRRRRHMKLTGEVAAELA